MIKRFLQSRFQAVFAADAVNIPRLETPRLILRQMTEDDAEDMFDYSHRSEVTEYLLWEEHPSLSYTRRYLCELQEKYRLGNYYDWGIELRDSGKMIGSCGFASLDTEQRHGEIGYVLNPDYHRQGYATEALSCVLAFGFATLHLNRIEARYMCENLPSRRVMDRCGMIFEGVLRQSMLVKGSYRNIGICSLLRSDYFSPDNGRNHR